MPQLPKPESPLTGTGNLTSPGWWIGGVTWFLAVAAMMAGAKYAGALISRQFPATKPWLSDIPLQDTTVVVQGRTQPMSQRRLWV